MLGKKINRFDSSMLVLVVTITIALAIYAIMGTPVSTGVTSLSNTTGYTGLNTTLTGGYSGWSTATTNLYQNTATLSTLAYWVIPLIVIMMGIRRVT